MNRAAAGPGGGAACAGPETGAAPTLAPVIASVQADLPDAAARLVAGLAPCRPALVLIFGSPRARIAAIAGALQVALPAARVAGCSSAGEFAAGPYGRGTAVAIGFPSAAFRADAVALRAQRDMPVSAWLPLLRALRARCAPRPGHALFGIVLPDGMARNEDLLVTALDAALPGVPVIGGSAGDALEFDATVQILDGEPVTGAAVFVLVESPLPVAQIVFDHFEPSARRAVVTAADPQRRIILELNAEPAAAEYARLAGLDPALMRTADFAANPLLLRMGGRHHVRAIIGTTPGGGLRLLSSIDTGTVLTLGSAGDLTRGFARQMEALPAQPLLVLGFDCILRRLSVERAGLQDDMGAMFARWRVAGFNTYGEQHSGMHVNQTFVGLAILPPPAAADDTCR